jgi:hypothetical protein
VYEHFLYPVFSRNQHRRKEMSLLVHASNQPAEQI